MITSELRHRHNIPCVVPNNIVDAWEVKAVRPYRPAPLDMRGDGVIPARWSIFVVQLLRLEVAAFKQQRQVGGMVVPRAGVQNPFVGPPLHEPAAMPVHACATEIHDPVGPPLQEPAAMPMHAYATKIHDPVAKLKYKTLQEAIERFSIVYKYSLRPIKTAIVRFKKYPMKSAFVAPSARSQDVRQAKTKPVFSSRAKFKKMLQYLAKHHQNLPHHPHTGYSGAPSILLVTVSLQAGERVLDDGPWQLV